MWRPHLVSELLAGLVFSAISRLRDLQFSFLIPADLASRFNEWFARNQKWGSESEAETTGANKVSGVGWTKEIQDRALELVMETGDRRLFDEYLSASARAYDHVDPPEDDLDEIQEAMWSLCYEILAFEASTLADLALQARVVQYIESEWWEKELPPTDEMY